MGFEELVIGIVCAIALIIIASCQIKQAWFPVIYPNAEDAGIEEPQEALNIDENSPLYKAVMSAYERKNKFARPTEFIEQIITEPGDSGVEVITDREELEL